MHRRLGLSNTAHDPLTSQSHQVFKEFKSSCGPIALMPSTELQHCSLTGQCLACTVTDEVGWVQELEHIGLLQGLWRCTGMSLPAEELALPQRSQQREVDEYASESLEDPALEGSKARPDKSERWAEEGEAGEVGDVSEDWADREGEGSTDYEAEAMARQDFAADAMDEEGRPGGDLGSEARNEIAGEAMEEERFGDPSDFSATEQKNPQGLTSGGAAGLKFAHRLHPCSIPGWKP